jgi:hypothetical protein
VPGATAGGELEHRWARVDADHRSRLTHLLGQLDTVEAGPAANVEDALAGGGAERGADNPAPAHRVTDPVQRLDPRCHLLVEFDLGHLDPPCLGRPTLRCQASGL